MLVYHEYVNIDPSWDGTRLKILLTPKQPNCKMQKEVDLPMEPKELESKSWTKMFMIAGILSKSSTLK